MLERFAGRSGGLGALLVVFLLTGACTGAAQPGPTAQPIRVGTFTLSDANCVYEGSGRAPSGQISAVLANSTHDQAHFDLWKLDPGHDYSELSAHLAEEGRRYRAGEPALGYPRFATSVAHVVVAPQATGTLGARLDPGVYGMACIRFKLPESMPTDWFPAGPLTAS
jgi:hypothetical protein